MIPETEIIEKGISALNTESKILHNDLNVMNSIVKSILGLQIYTIDDVEYIKASDIVDVCNKGFKSLSSKIMKDKGAKK